MQVHGGDNAGPGSNILWPELMSGGKETLLEKMKANGTMFECSFILSENFISEWTFSLSWHSSAPACIAKLSQLSAQLD